ncbi:MAG: hypothetical protein KDK78_03345 [Chlamydiia bacterium]|nr:hypothetical protein [Chlamydiia bacterium]
MSIHPSDDSTRYSRQLETLTQAHIVPSSLGPNSCEEACTVYTARANAASLELNRTLKHIQETRRDRQCLRAADRISLLALTHLLEGYINRLPPFGRHSHCCWRNTSNYINLSRLTNEARCLPVPRSSMSYLTHLAQQTRQRLKEVRTFGEQAIIKQQQAIDRREVIDTAACVGGLGGAFGGALVSTALLFAFPPVGLIGIIGSGLFGIGICAATSIVEKKSQLGLLKENFPDQMEACAYSIGQGSFVLDYPMRLHIACKLSTDLGLDLGPKQCEWAACKDVFKEFLTRCEYADHRKLFRDVLETERSHLLFPEIPVST